MTFNQILKTSQRWIWIPCLLLVWSLFARYVHLGTWPFPSPWVTFQKWWWLFKNGTLVRDIGASLFHVIYGFSISAIVAISLGVLMGWYRKLFDYLNPFINLIRPTPPAAWLPLVVFVWGIGLLPGTLLVVYGSFFPILLNTINGVQNVEKKYVTAALTLGLGRRRLMWNIILPAAFPSILVGLRMGFGFAWMVLIIAELIAVQSGLGYRILLSVTTLEPESIIAGMITIGIVGLGLDQTFRRLVDRYILKWQKGIVL